MQASDGTPLITGVTGPDELALGNRNAKRDRGYAKEYVDVLWRSLPGAEPAGTGVGTGLQNSVHQCVDLPSPYVELDPHDSGEVDSSWVRPAEVDTLLAEPTKAREELGWSAHTGFEELMSIRVDADFESQKRVSGRRRGQDGTR